jgi:hypothetical protein
MHRSYYYLTASLPYLFFGREMPIAIETFFDECAKWLSGEDLKILQEFRVDNTEENKRDSTLVLGWKRFNKEIKEELAKEKALKKNKTAGKSSSTYVSEIYDEKTPLLMEERYEKIRWTFIEQQEFHYGFDVNWLLIYLVKLRILERLAQFNKVKGMYNFEKACSIGNE